MVEAFDIFVARPFLAVVLAVMGVIPTVATGYDRSVLVGGDFFVSGDHGANRLDHIFYFLCVIGQFFLNMVCNYRTAATSLRIAGTASSASASSSYSRINQPW